MCLVLESYHFGLLAHTFSFPFCDLRARHSFFCVAAKSPSPLFRPLWNRFFHPVRHISVLFCFLKTFCPLSLSLLPPLPNAAPLLLFPPVTSPAGPGFLFCRPDFWAPSRTVFIFLASCSWPPPECCTGCLPPPGLISVHAYMKRSSASGLTAAPLPAPSLDAANPLCRSLFLAIPHLAPLTKTLPLSFFASPSPWFPSISLVTSFCFPFYGRSLFFPT